MPVGISDFQFSRSWVGILFVFFTINFLSCVEITFLLGIKVWPIYRKTFCAIIYIYGHIIRITPMKKNSVLSFYFK